jgi:hypothetical protein
MIACTQPTRGLLVVTFFRDLRRHRLAVFWRHWRDCHDDDSERPYPAGRARAACAHRRRARGAAGTPAGVAAVITPGQVQPSEKGLTP